MLYCQYLSGMGHLVRSTQFAKALATRFETTVVIGGPRIDGFVPPPGLEILYLPPLWLQGGTFRVANDGQSVDAVKAARARALITAFDEVRPDVVITEFFPFGRHDLLFELRPWMEHIRRTAPETLVVSSLRDLIGKTVLDDQVDLIASLANRYFDAALIHADPGFLRFETCFPAPEKIRCPILHTGFIAQECDAAPVEADKPFILVSIGGGRIGGEVLDAAISAAALLRASLPHDFRVFTGPFLEDADFDRLSARAAALPNVVLERFTPNLMAYMQAADLSVSLAGYNTTMNVLRAEVPAVLVPIGHYDFDCEQLQRARQLADLGVVQMLLATELSPHRLAEAIRAGLGRGPVPTPFNLDGAATATDAIASLLDRRLADARPLNRAGAGG